MDLTALLNILYKTDISHIMQMFNQDNNSPGEKSTSKSLSALQLFPDWFYYECDFSSWSSVNQLTFIIEDKVCSILSDCNQHKNLKHKHGRQKDKVLWISNMIYDFVEITWRTVNIH